MNDLSLVPLPELLDEVRKRHAVMVLIGVPLASGVKERAVPNLPRGFDGIGVDGQAAWLIGGTLMDSLPEWQRLPAGASVACQLSAVMTGMAIVEARNCGLDPGPLLVAGQVQAERLFPELHRR